MRRETFRLSQKELQRVAVISSCVKGDLACARAAELLDLTTRHVKRLKSRYRQGGEVALAHASRGRPSHRRLRQRLRDRILLWPAPPLPASTTITSVKNWSRFFGIPALSGLSEAKSSSSEQRWE